MKEIKITSNGIKQAIDDLVNENERLQDKVYKLEDIIKEVREYIEKQVHRNQQFYEMDIENILEILDRK